MPVTVSLEGLWLLLAAFLLSAAVLKWWFMARIEVLMRSERVCARCGAPALDAKSLSVDSCVLKLIDENRSLAYSVRSAQQQLRLLHEIHKCITPREHALRSKGHSFHGCTENEKCAVSAGGERPTALFDHQLARRSLSG